MDQRPLLYYDKDWHYAPYLGLIFGLIISLVLLTFLEEERYLSLGINRYLYFAYNTIVTALLFLGSRKYVEWLKKNGVGI